jgi:hypothetical protein
MKNVVVLYIYYVLTVINLFSFQEDSKILDDMGYSLCYELFERFASEEGIESHRKSVLFVVSEKDCDFLYAWS